MSKKPKKSKAKAVAVEDVVSDPADGGQHDDQAELEALEVADAEAATEQEAPAEQQQAEEISEEESKRQLHIRQNQFRGEL